MVLRLTLIEPASGVATLALGVSPGLGQANGRAPAKAPESRWQSAGEMRSAVLL